MFRPCWLLVIAFVLAGSAKASAAFIPVSGDSADGTVDVNGLGQDYLLTQLRAGSAGNDLRGIAPILFFELPTLPSLDSLVSAELRISYLGISIFTVTTTPEFNADLFGLGTRSTPTILGSDYYDGNAAGSSDTLLVQGLVTPTTAAGTLQVSSSFFFNYIRSLYNSDGTLTATYAVFRLNADVELPVGSNPYRGYEFGSGDNTDGFAPQLRLEISPVPEPAGITQMSIGLAVLLIASATRLRQRAATFT